MGVDSGAAVTVIPKWSRDAYPVVMGDGAGTTYRAATNQAVRDGPAELVGRPNGQGPVMGIRARVADVHKALISVAEVVDKGFRVVFDTEKTRAATPATWCARATATVSSSTAATRSTR